MGLLTNVSSVALWKEALHQAQEACSITLNMELEAYLVYMLIHYTNEPELTKRMMAIQFLEGLQLPNKQREAILQSVGDQCLLLAGLFPKIVERRQVKISYLVELGRSAYAIISKTATDLPRLLSLQFVTLMDILQSIRCNAYLSPLEAYEQWYDLNSQRALKMLRLYTIQKQPPISHIGQIRHSQ